MARILSFLDATFHIDPPRVPHDTHPETTTRNVFREIRERLPGYEVTLNQSPPFIKVLKTLSSLSVKEYEDTKGKVVSAVNEVFKELYATH